MANGRGYGAALRQVNRIFEGGTVAGLTEGQLLERFVTRRDEIAFEALVARHGPMVFGVCRRILRDPSDAEDAFQATFLVLVRQARSIRGRDTLGGWLHRVAYRVAIRASASRRKSEPVALDSLAAPEAADRDLIALIHEELDRLPAKYRAPIILCDLENHTHEQAAEALRWPLGTVKGRLSRARTLLKDRLIRRGVGAPAVAVGLALGRDAKAIVSPILLDSTVKAAMSLAAGTGLVAGAASAVAVGLAQGVTRTMFWQSIKLTTATLVALSLVGVAGVGTFGQVPGGEGKGAVVVDEPKQVDPLSTDPPAPAAPDQPKHDPDADLRPTAKALLGTWNVVEKIDGDIDEIGLPFKDKIVITRDRIQLGKPGEADLTYGLNLLEQPKSIGMTPKFGPHEKALVNGVFQLDGDRLTIAYMGLDHKGTSPGPIDGIQPGGSIFVVNLEREGSEPPVASPEADITKLQGAWFLREQVYRVRGKQYGISKLADPPGMYGEIGAGFVVDRYDIRDNRSTNNGPPIIAKIIGYDGGTTPKQIDIELTDKSLQFNQGIPLGKAIYKLEGDRFTICYDPAHLDVRPQGFPRAVDNITRDTRVESVFERVVPPAAFVTTPPKAEKPQLTPLEYEGAKLQGGWILHSQTIRFGGVEYVNKFGEKRLQYVNKFGEQGKYGVIGKGFFIDRYDIRDNQSTNNEPPIVAHINYLQFHADAMPKQIDIHATATGDKFLPTRGIPIGKGTYTLHENRFTICYDPLHPDVRPEQFPRDGDDLTNDTRVVSVFERVTPPPAAKTHPNGDIRGRWKRISFVENGTPELLPPGLHDDVFTDTMHGQLDDNGLVVKSEYRVDTQAEPWRIKVTDLASGELQSGGIFKIDGDRLTICFARPGATFPSDYESKPGSQHQLLTLEWVGPITEDLKDQTQRARETRLGKTRAGTEDALPPPAVYPAVKNNLQGRWKIISLVSDGESAPSFPEFIITDSMFGRVDEAKQIDYFVDYRTDTTATPNRLDMFRPREPSLDTMYAIYKVDGDNLLICFSGPKDLDRPREFISKEGSGRNLLTLKRIGDVTPEMALQLQRSREKKQPPQEKPDTIAPPPSATGKARAKPQPPEEKPVPPASNPANPPAPAAEPTAKYDLRGRWKLISVIHDGVDRPMRASHSTTVFSGSVTGPANDDGFVGYGTDYTVNIKTVPMQIDRSTPQVGTAPPSMARGIYRIDGDRLTVCYGAKDGDRPTEFEAKRGSSRHLMVYQWVGPLTESLELKLLQARAQRLVLLSDPEKANALDPPPPPPALATPLPPPAPEPSPKDDLRGRWKVISIVKNGELTPIPDKTNDVVFTKTLYGSIDENVAGYTWDYRIEPNTTHINFLRFQIGGQLKLHPCLFRLEGDELTLCFPDLESSQRPTDFVTTPGIGSGIHLVTYKRVSPLTEEWIAQVYRARAERLQRLMTPTSPAVAPPAPAAPLPPRALETHPDGDIRGQWKLVSRVDGGQVDEVSPKWTAVYSDYWYGEINEKGVRQASAYRVETDVEPWQLKYVSETNGAVNLAGIYKIEGDRLTVCLAPGTADEVMTIPSEFESKPGSRRQLLTFQWAGPITEIMRKQLHESHDVQQKRSLERHREVSERLAAIQREAVTRARVERPTRAPKDLDAERAEQEIEQSILTMEATTLMDDILRTSKAIKNRKEGLQDAANPKLGPSEFTPETLKEMRDELPKLQERLESLKKAYIAKNRESSRHKELMESIAQPRPERGPTDPDLPPVHDGASSLPARRLADFDHQIRLLQQKRDAFLMNLPDEERRKLSKELAFESGRVDNMWEGSATATP